MTLISLPVQSERGSTVRGNVSQFTPSTQVASPLEVPPVAVPFQASAGPVAVAVPAAGLAARAGQLKRKRPDIVNASIRGPGRDHAARENMGLLPRLSGSVVCFRVSVVGSDALAFGSDATDLEARKLPG